jgi:hypothetical protein
MKSTAAFALTPGRATALKASGAGPGAEAGPESTSIAEDAARGAFRGAAGLFGGMSGGGADPLPQLHMVVTSKTAARG